MTLNRLALASSIALAWLGVSFPMGVLADEPTTEYSPFVAPASNEPEIAIKGMRIPDGFEVSVFAAEPLLANPIAFCLDERGRCYVAETFRVNRGVTDNREHMTWLDDDLAARTVADRVAMYKKHLGDEAASYAVEHDRIRLVEDRDGDGKAETSTVFADGFNEMATGLGAGVLARRGDVWYTCIPDLWLLRDDDGDGRTDVRRSLHTGYGVHVAFYGHDLHGLVMGPDGKIYFSVGDRGLHVETEGRSLVYPDTGAVLRCNPDGSGLEVFAHGLRNPQELAFDQFGNLFTVDNNSDSGDQARLVYVVEGGDSGWRMGFQYLEAPFSRGPWNLEKIWLPPPDNAAADVVPPLTNLSNGPSGLAYYPGVGMPERYREHFVLCEFRGSAANSGLLSFAVRPKGASFELLDQHEFLWNVLATDVEFGPDCALYVCDWVDGWEGTGKGRIYKLAPTAPADPPVAEVKSLLAERLEDRPLDELAALLEHADMRVRQEAQFALASQGERAIETLAGVLNASSSQAPRRHAIWGLGQIAKQEPAALEPIVAALGDPDPEIRSQAAKVAGEARHVPAFDALVAQLSDPDPRPRFFAAIALGKLGRAEAVEPLLALARDNADADAYLRHAAVMGLAGAGDQASLAAAATDSSPSARLAALLALRRLGSTEVARFLADSEPAVVAEAVRAINDEPISAALPDLAALVSRLGLSDAVWLRVLNANFRLGGPEHARSIAAVAARDDVSEVVRVEALRQLADWAAPSGRDRVMGLWRPLDPRPLADAADALRPVLGGVFSGPDEVRREAAQVAAHLGIKEIGPALFQLVQDRAGPPGVRVEAARALEVLGDVRLEAAMNLALDDPDPLVRTEGRRILAAINPAGAIASLQVALEGGELAEQQGALLVLGGIDRPQAERLLADRLDALLAGSLPGELELETLQALALHSSTKLKARLERFNDNRRKLDQVARHHESLAGGSAARGERIFFDKTEVACVRCHKVGGRGGEIGPDISSIGLKQTRQYLLESLVDPNRAIAKGFEPVAVVTSEGLVHVGVLRSEDDQELTLMTAEGKLLAIPKDQIDERAPGKSAMPDTMVRFLSKSEIRDLVEFMSGLRAEPPADR